MPSPSGTAVAQLPWEAVEAAIKDNNLNRVVIGGCSPRTHEPKFQDAARRAGLNKYLVEMVNLRDQDAWVHVDQPEEALTKAYQLLDIGIAGVKAAKPLAEQTLPMNQDALVLGGGVTGMTSALQLADQGIKTYLVEKSAALGGLAASVHKTLEGDDASAFTAQMIEKVQANENIEVLTDSKVVDHSGIPGLFKTSIQTGSTVQELDHGVTILATGAVPNRPEEYGLGTSDAIVTQLDLDAVIEDNPDKIKAMDQIVMIQCVGSREGDNPNCSRVCCQAAMKNALRIRELNPDANIFVLYRDIRTYGFIEDTYREARNQDVQFIRFTLDRKPKVTVDGDKVSVEVFDDILGQPIQIETDCLALSTRHESRC